MKKQLVPAILMAVVLTVLVGLIYPLAVTAVAQATMSDAADGSIVRVDGRRVGSTLIGQQFTSPEYFHPRPSAAGAEGYDASASAGSNLGPSSEELVNALRARAEAYRTENDLADADEVPVDAITASGSGLDPHISLANARLQAPRVARERSLPLSRVQAFIADATEGRQLGFLGERGVNVLALNISLDQSA